KIKEDEEKECNRSKPTLTTTQNTFTKDKGDSATYEIITHNNDKKCGTTDFKLEAKGPDGWKIEFENGNDNVNMRDVASNGQRPKNLKVTSPKNATAGEKHITVKLAETAGGRSRTDTLTLNYKVKSGTGGGGGSGGGGGDQCKGDNTKPHFECQNKACVKVSSCGQNSGGCTKEGQTCGGGGGGGGGGDGDGDKKCTSNNCTAPKSCVNNTCVTPTKKPDEGDKPCQRKDPGLTVTPESQSADKGEQVQYTVEIENKNSGKCDKNNFELTKDIPGGQNTKWSSGWVDQLNKFELGNGEKGTSILKVTSPNDVTNGKKPIVVKVQSGDGKFTKQVSVTYEVTTGSGKQCSLDEDCPADEYCPLNKCQPGEPCPQISAICKTGCRIDPDNCGTGKVCDESTRTCIDQSGTKLIINALGLHGIGTAGDAVAPGTDGNLNPLRTQRPATIEIENENKELVTSEEITINYNADTGKFSSEAVLDELQNFGSFLAFIRVDGFLRAQFPGITNLTKGGTTTVRDTAMTNGDVNGDNYLTLKDFVIFRSCSIYSKDRGACDEDPNFESLTDFNDDGNIDDIDETLWTREKSVVQGD
ncbi:MAG: hypothetical protein HYT09_00685, partial [Candidatus Levybacteria bacterium]|nr:hypothetical protein [Candidatus Levybacteria bacterium]